MSAKFMKCLIFSRRSQITVNAKLSLSHCLSLSSILTGTVMLKYSHTPSNVIQLSNYVAQGFQYCC